MHLSFRPGDIVKALVVLFYCFKGLISWFRNFQIALKTIGCYLNYTLTQSIFISFPLEMHGRTFCQPQRMNLVLFLQKALLVSLCSYCWGCTLICGFSLFPVSSSLCYCWLCGGILHPGLFNAFSFSTASFFWGRGYNKKATSESIPSTITIYRKYD